MDIKEKEELERIYERDQALDPLILINEAKDEDNPLHNRFTWDDGKAAHEHRLNEARKLIRIAVSIIPQLNNEPVRTYISLTPLRGNGGSYIATATLLTDDERYRQARDDALTMMSSLQKRFNYIRELEPVWDALAEVLALKKAG